MALNDFDIANRALGRIGNREFITSLDTTVDGSENAELCSKYYAPARDRILSRAPWRFASRMAALLEWDAGVTYPDWASGTTYVKNAQVTGPDGNVYYSRQGGNVGHTPSGDMDDVWWAPGAGAQIIPGWQYTYGLPDDYLQAQYVFSGARPGAMAVPTIDAALLFGVTSVGMLPAINGAPPQVPFVVQAGYLFTDLPNAKLIYTYAAEDVTTFPALVVDAIATELAVDLALADATKAKLAVGLRSEAQAALDRAAAAEANSEQPDFRPDSSFVAVRG
ncbi:MAG: hypothetical protein JST92_22665 [Deltaproteobacteria bacterium]|nr:hypothetical protein [Deltaproteobacteria bacterium]